VRGLARGSALINQCLGGRSTATSKGSCRSSSDRTVQGLSARWRAKTPLPQGERGFILCWPPASSTLRSVYALAPKRGQQQRRSSDDHSKPMGRRWKALVTQDPVHPLEFGARVEQQPLIEGIELALRVLALQPA